MACEKSQGRLNSYGCQRGECKKQAAWKWALWFFTQLVFISVPHCKNIWSRNPASILLPIHTFSDIGEVGNHLHEETVPAVDTFCSGLPLFSYYSLSECQGGYSEQWEPITMVMNEMDIRWCFFSFIFHPYSCTHTHICSCLHLLVSVDCLIFMGSLSAAHPHTHSEKQYSWKFRILEWERAVFVAATETVHWEVRISLFLRSSLHWFMWRSLCSSRHPVMCFIKSVRNAQGGQ